MRNVLLIALLPLTALAGSDGQPIYLVGVEDVRYSPNYDHDGDEFLGVARELLDDFSKRSGIRFEYRVLPVNRLYTELVAGTIDFKYPDSPDWGASIKGDAAVHYSASCVDYVDGLMVLPEKRGAAIAQLNTIGTILGFTPVAYEDMLTSKTLVIEEATTAVGLLKMAAMRRIDGAYLNIDVGRYYLRHELRDPYALVWDQTKPYFVGSYRLSSIKHPGIIRALDDYLILNKIWVDQLRDRYRVNEAIGELETVLKKKSASESHSSQP